MPTSCKDLKTTTLPPSFDSDNPPDLSIMPKPAAPPPDPPADVTGTEWVASPCEPKARYRYTDNGKIEVESLGIPTMPWPQEVDDFRPLIEQSADAAGISRALLAGLVAAESGGSPSVVSTDGRMGLTQIPREMAKAVGNPDFPVDMEPMELSDTAILHPARNLLYGATLLAYYLSTKDMNLIAALAMYDQGKVACEPKPICDEPNRWGVLCDCEYIDQVIAHTNAAVDHGYSGPRQVDLGAGPQGQEKSDEEDKSLIPYLFFGAVGAGVAYALTAASKKPRR